MKYRFLTALALVFLALFSITPESYAQTAPSGTYLFFPGQATTYRATVAGVSPAASATDFLVIQGSASKTIRVRDIHCSGVSTAAATAFLQLVKRSAADTGTLTAATLVPLNSSNGAATATVGTYAANPSALGTAVGSVDAGYLTTGTLASSAVADGQINFDFSNQNLFLSGAAQTLALNANGQSFSAGTALTCTVEWSEI